MLNSIEVAKRVRDSLGETLAAQSMHSCLQDWIIRAEDLYRLDQVAVISVHCLHLTTRLPKATSLFYDLVSLDIMIGLLMIISLQHSSIA